MEIYNERVSDLLSAEDKTIKIQEVSIRSIFFAYGDKDKPILISKQCLFSILA
jgi:hypothetical protein